MRLSKSRTLQAGVAVTCALLLTAVYADSERDQKSVRLHSGWTITPAGKHQKTGDMLLGCALSPDGQTLALTSAGYAPHTLHLVDTATGKIRQSLPLERAWNGIVWSKDGSALYVSGGASPRIHVFRKEDQGKFGAGQQIDLPDLTQDASKEKEKGQAYVAGLALSPDGSTLYAANIATDTIYALSLPDGKVKTRKPLAQGARPYCLRFAPDGSVLYVTQWALSSLLALNPNDLSTSRVLQTGNHPNDFVFAPDGRAFVSCGNDDTVVVLDPLNGRTHEQIRVSLTPRSPAGTTPNALALSPDGHSLFVANADNNAVAVVDISRPGSSRVRGFIPTGWYPTARLRNARWKAPVHRKRQGAWNPRQPCQDAPYRSGRSQGLRLYRHLARGSNFLAGASR